VTVIVGFETATEALAVGLWIDGALRVRDQLAPQLHARELLGQLRLLMSEAELLPAQIDAIAVGRGPGAFTGVRIGLAAAQGLALGWDRPVLPISTLKVLAEPYAVAERAVVAAIDARMGELYVGAFMRGATGLLETLAPERLLAVADFAAAAVQSIGVGSGFALIDPARFPFAMEPAALPTAAGLLRLAAATYASGGTVDAADALPHYLRNEVAKKATR
jgi:tRNA threonylcarbamoyladenosine biosynthesis protein TsaB